MLQKPAFDIPILFYTHVDTTLKNKIKNLQESPTHLNISLLIANALGYEANIDILKTPENYIILGNDMDGFAGYLELNIKDGKLIDYKRKDI